VGSWRGGGKGGGRVSITVSWQFVRSRGMLRCPWNKVSTKSLIWHWHAPPSLLLQMKKAFSQRRKVMRNSLQPLLSAGQVSDALCALGLNPDARAQDLTLDDFVRLAWQLQQDDDDDDDDDGKGSAAEAGASPSGQQSD
jgi:hypothetical protein